MLKPRSPQASFYGSYLYDRIVPVDHLLRKINQVVDFSFVNDLVKDRYTPDFGRPAEDPEFMLRLCLLQYLYGDSDREVIENTTVNLAYKYFLGLAIDEEVTDFSTISYFRTIRLGEEKFRQIFQQIVQQCVEKGLVKGKRQIIDSTHIEADVARNSLTGLIKLCRRNLLQDIQKQNAGLAGKLGPADLHFTKQDKFARKEDSLEEEINQATKLLDIVTHELKNEVLAVTPELARSLGLLEKAVADRQENSVDRLVSPVDPDARIGKKTKKSWAGYKGHVIVEEESEIITAIETTPANRDDGTELKSLLRQQKEAYDLVPEELSGDKAYDSGENLELLDCLGTVGYISLMGKNNWVSPDFFTVDDFIYNETNDTLTCPAGYLAPYHRRSVFNNEVQKKKGNVFLFKPEQCNTCGLKPLCNKGKRGRAVYISYYEPLFQQMKQRIMSTEGKEKYRNRSRIEHKIADLARHCGMRRCRYRGLAKAKIHTLLAAMASNVKRMTRLLCSAADKSPEFVVAAS